MPNYISFKKYWENINCRSSDQRYVTEMGRCPSREQVENIEPQRKPSPSFAEKGTDMKKQVLPLLMPVLFCSTLLLTGHFSLAAPSELSRTHDQTEKSNSTRSNELLRGDSAPKHSGLQLTDKNEGSSANQSRSLAIPQDEDRSDDSKADSMKLSGAGRNGPDQSGVSIPMVIDRGITLARFLKAKLACEQQASQLLLSQMLRQEVGNLVFNPRIPKMAILDLNGKPVYYQFQVGNPDSAFSASVPTVYFRAPFRLEVFSVQDYSILVQGFVPSRYSVSPEIEKRITTAYAEEAHFSGGLAMSYQIKKDSGYNEFGSFSEGSQLVVAYQIQASPLVRDVPNSNQKIPTPFKLSAEDFKQCMHNQLN